MGFHLQCKQHVSKGTLKNRKIQVLVQSEVMFEMLRFKDVWEPEVDRGGYLVHYMGA